MVLINAAIKEAATKPSNPFGNRVSIAGYATSWPNLSEGRFGNAVCKSDNSG